MNNIFFEDMVARITMSKLYLHEQYTWYECIIYFMNSWKQKIGLEFVGNTPY